MTSLIDTPVQCFLTDLKDNSGSLQLGSYFHYFSTISIGIKKAKTGT